MSPKKVSATQTKCKDCGAPINLPKKAELNEIIQCLECGIEYEIISLKPIKLGPAPTEEEDWGE